MADQRGQIPVGDVNDVNNANDELTTQDPNEEMTEGTEEVLIEEGHNPHPQPPENAAPVELMQQGSRPALPPPFDMALLMAQFKVQLDLMSDKMDANICSRMDMMGNGIRADMHAMNGRLDVMSSRMDVMKADVRWAK